EMQVSVGEFGHLHGRVLQRVIEADHNIRRTWAKLSQVTKSACLCSQISYIWVGSVILLCKFDAACEWSGPVKKSLVFGLLGLVLGLSACPASESEAPAAAQP